MEKLPKIAQKSPYIVEEKCGKKAFCTCGLSNRNPYCDGSHKGGLLRSDKYLAKSDKEIWFCGCKRTKHQPFCDGSHSKF